VDNNPSHGSHAVPSQFYEKVWTLYYEIVYYFLNKRSEKMHNKGVCIFLQHNGW